ncbi:MAG TPA: hypothetical protein PK491_13340, partial [Candidatus Hydrogenedentes bacterium]|nr:hypothetical protein [Candidatus Hydrogenedentota bacterium]
MSPFLFLNNCVSNLNPRPRFRDGVVETAPLYDLYLQDKMHQEDYVKLVNRFNALEDDSRSPEHFLDLFVEVVQAEDEEG